MAFGTVCLLIAACLLQGAIAVAGEPERITPGRPLDHPGSLLNGLIAFQSNRDGSWAVYVVKPDGTGLRRLTAPEWNARLPQWTFDNRKLACLATIGGTPRVVCIADEPGAKPEILPPDDAPATAFHITRSGWMMTVKTGPRQWKLARKAPPEKEWTVAGIDLGKLDANITDVDIIPAPNGRRVALRLVRKKGLDRLALADISADGRLGEMQDIGPGIALVWAGESTELLTCCYGTGGCDVFLHDVVRGARRRITSERGWEWTPAPSPTKEWLVYSARLPGSVDPAKDEADIVIRLLADGVPIRLTTHKSANLHPTWRGTVVGSNLPDDMKP